MADIKDISPRELGEKIVEVLYRKKRKGNRADQRRGADLNYRVLRNSNRKQPHADWCTLRRGGCKAYRMGLASDKG